MTTDGPPDDAVIESTPNRVPLYAVLAAICMALAITLLATAAKSNPKSPPGPVMITAMVASFGGAIGGVIAMASNLHRRRTQRLMKEAQSIGLRPTLEMSRDARKRAFTLFAGLTMLRGGEKDVRLHAVGESGGLPVEVIEHRHVVSTGKSAHVITHAASATPVPATWPRVSLTPRGAFAKLWEAVAGKDLQLEDDAFNQRWTVKSDTPDFAILLLSPDVQRFLADADPRETWHVTPGALCRVVRSNFKPGGMAVAIRRVAAFRAMLHPELDYWGTR
jgi:hypothetical protein